MPARRILRTEDGSRHDVARRELPARVHVEHKAPARVVAKHGTGAAHGLGDEVARAFEHRGMELHEFHVRDERTGPRGGKNAVARGARRAGRARVYPAISAGGEDDGIGKQDAPVRFRAGHDAVAQDERMQRTLR